ncbi:MAG: methylamine utilization protein [Candidatus Riflebacteria bacterium]|nr:methylamine utilization protein [Candidatus Riflebacteria bacterium]
MKNRIFYLLIVLSMTVPLCANDFTITVKDGGGKPVENAVVALKPGVVVPKSPASGPSQIIQKGKEFLPLVTVIQVGGEVEFPNLDSVQHHVYSFSKPKRFDIPLYKESTPKPIVFDKPGVVVLGCNIHDWMKAFIYVVDTPYFAKSGPDGRIKLDCLPPGKYQVEFWHPRLKKILGTGLPQSVELDEKNSRVFTVSIELKKEIAPTRNEGGYEAGTYP